MTIMLVEPLARSIRPRLREEAGDPPSRAGTSDCLGGGYLYMGRAWTRRPRKQSRDQPDAPQEGGGGIGKGDRIRQRRTISFLFFEHRCSGREAARLAWRTMEVVTMDDKEVERQEAYRAGACRYLLKDLHSTELIRAIEGPGKLGCEKQRAGGRVPP